MRVGKKQFILLFQYTRGDKGRSNERKKLLWESLHTGCQGETQGS